MFYAKYTYIQKIHLLITIKRYDRAKNENLLFQFIFEKCKITRVCKVVFAMIRTKWSPEMAAQHKTNKTTKWKRINIGLRAEWMSFELIFSDHSLALHDLFDWTLKVVLDLLHHFINIRARKGYTLTAEHPRKDLLQTCVCVCVCACMCSNIFIPLIFAQLNFTAKNALYFTLCLGIKWT